MESLQVTGKRINAAKLSGMFKELAESIPQNTNAIASLDADQYGIQTAFVIDGTVISLNILNKEGGTL